MAPPVSTDAELNPAQRLHALGQSLWLDSINRVMLRTGALARYVRDLAVTGLTSNPTILGHAMAAGPEYDSSLARLAGDGVTDAQDLVYALALEDLTEAAALFRPEWERTEGVDGYVSLEVPPDVDTYYLGRLAAADTIDTVPEQTLLAFADHGSPDDRLEPDYAAAERAVAAAADAGIDADALAEQLQRHGAGAFIADWAALLTAIREKAAKLTS